MPEESAIVVRVCYSASRSSASASAMSCVHASSNVTPVKGDGMPSCDQKFNAVFGL